MKTNGLTQGDNSNTCAARLSKALNYSGVTIPNIPGKTFKGADNKYYFLGAANMIRWMRKTFGCANPNTSIGEYLNQNSKHFNQQETGLHGENLGLLINGYRGIYTITTNTSWATGHCDLMFENATCDGSCYFGVPPIVYGCDIWIMP